MLEIEYWPCCYSHTPHQSEELNTLDAACSDSLHRSRHLLPATSGWGGSRAARSSVTDHSDRYYSMLCVSTVIMNPKLFYQNKDIDCFSLFSQGYSRDRCHLKHFDVILGKPLVPSSVKTVLQ